MQMRQTIFWDFISENVTLHEFWRQILDRKPKRVSEKEWNFIIFELFFDVKWHKWLCHNVGFGWEKLSKIAKFGVKWVKMSDFLSSFCDILPTNLKSHILALFLHLILDIIAFGHQKPCIFAHFSMFFRSFLLCWLDLRPCFGGGTIGGRLTLNYGNIGYILDVLINSGYKFTVIFISRWKIL